jgi:hypothetical protein
MYDFAFARNPLVYGPMCLGVWWENIYTVFLNSCLAYLIWLPNEGEKSQYIV